MSHRWVLPILICVAGCSRLGFDVLRAPADSDPRGDAVGTGSDGMAGDAGSSSPLSGNGLLVRYFLNEAASGQAPLFLADASANEVDLSISYDEPTDPVWASTPAGRGLRWLSLLSSGRACSTGTAPSVIEQRLTGASTATWEVVASVADATTGPSRFTNIGVDALWALGLGYDGTNIILGVLDRFRTDWARWPVDMTNRRVLHVVFDSNAPDPADRAHAYVDGVRQPAPTGLAIPAGSTLTVDAAAEFCIGNRGSGGVYNRALVGVISYVALYDRALDASEAAANAAVLMANDD